MRFSPLDPRRTALVVIDMQNGFTLPGQPIYFDGAETIIPNINRLARAVRSSGGAVVWVKQTFRDDEPRFAIPPWRSRFLPTMQRGLSATLARGSFGYQLNADLDVRPEDPQVDKTRWGAMMPNSSELHEVLKAAGIDTFIAVGCASDACVETTVREAAMLDYKTLFVMDATATDSDETHNAAILTLNHLSIVDLVTTDDLVAELERAAVAPAG